jgi:hypothetical protein
VSTGVNASILEDVTRVAYKLMHPPVEQRCGVAHGPCCTEQNACSEVNLNCVFHLEGDVCEPCGTAFAPACPQPVPAGGAQLLERRLQGTPLCLCPRTVSASVDLRQHGSSVCLALKLSSCVEWMLDGHCALSAGQEAACGTMGLRTCGQGPPCKCGLMDVSGTCQPDPEGCLSIGAASREPTQQASGDPFARICIRTGHGLSLTKRLFRLPATVPATCVRPCCALSDKDTFITCE